VSSKNKNIRELYREINEFKKGYQSSNNLVRDEKDDLLKDSILKRWKNYFPWLLNVLNVHDVKLIEVCTAEQLVLDLSPFEVKIAFAELKKNKSSGCY
jgi:hypothetical protein